jgi:phage gpG-like protein
MEFRVEVTSQQAAGRLRLIADRLPAVTMATTVKAGHIAELRIKKMLNQTSHRPHTPTPSQPGQPPSLVNGHLFRSIRVSDPIEAFGTVRVQVGPTIIYGRIQELGGDTGRNHATHLPKRPYVKPGTLDSVAEVGQLYRLAWAGVISGA